MWGLEVECENEIFEKFCNVIDHYFFHLPLLRKLLLRWVILNWIKKWKLKIVRSGLDS